ncbi:MAG: lipid-binding SYLF domain-containing protein [Gammaproteobacteria bacterium]
MRNRVIKLVLLVFVTSSVAACAGWNPDRIARADRESREAIAQFMKRDPSLKTFFDKAYAYVVFPTVGKGAVGIGGAHGSGVVYRHGRRIGLASMTQLSIGWQLGGESYREIIFFKNAGAFDTFKSGSLKFSAQASAVAATAGAAAKTSYANNVAVFTMIRGGLMYEASVGGQSFSYEPL